MTANEVRKGDFVYRDVLFVDPGGDKRHPRASVAELKDLLLPKKGHAVPKDQVGHWYEAQLLHYGLPRTKDKNTAKVRLTSAIAAGSLAVPTHISQLEADMKKDFAAANRRAKTVAKKTQEADSPKAAAASAGKKRKRASDNDTQANVLTTKMSVTVGNVTFDIDHSEGGVKNSKKRKTVSTPAKASSGKASSTTKKEKQPAATSKQPTSVAKPFKKLTTTSVSKSPVRGATAKPSSSRSPKQQTGRKSKTPAKTPNSRASPLPSTTSKQESPYVDNQHDDDVQMEDAPPLRDSLNIDQKPDEHKDQ